MTRTSTLGRADRHPDLLQFTRLEEPQQERLHARRHLAKLIEEDRAVMGQFELSGLVAERPGEAAFDMAEQLGFEERFGEAGAVDRERNAD